MGAFQFGHIDTYARKPKAGQRDSAKSAPARGVSEILGEAARMTENCPHVTNPLPPVHIAGMTPEELAERVDQLLAERAIEGKRKPRGDVHVLAAAVYSWPEHVDYYDEARLNEWMADQITWHAENVGQVDCVVLHLDESFPHIHVYTVDPDARRLVPGWQAKREALAAGAAGREANKAYRDAMVGWQDRLYEEVGCFHGLDRLGPKRQRLPRPEWRSAKQERLDAGDRLRLLRETGKLAERIKRTPPAKPKPPRKVNTETVWRPAIAAAGQPRKSLFGGELFTREQLEQAVKKAAGLAASEARADEQQRLEPVLQQAKLVQGAHRATIEAEAKRVEAEKAASEAARALQDALGMQLGIRTTINALEAEKQASSALRGEVVKLSTDVAELHAQLDAERQRAAALADKVAEYKRPAPKPQRPGSSYEPD